MFEALGDFSTASVGACDEPSDAVGKSVVILRDGFREAAGIEDRELVHGLFPVVRRTAPVGRDVAQGQPDSLAAASSLGKCPRVLMILRSRALMLSIAFVV